ncbi:MAG: SpaA isopeptide-forming pilin-related protein [Clostridia bacterium]|nr:SpaA isopeptide-forming pilin-related protein [Clostridia bacterium]
MKQNINKNIKKIIIVLLVMILISILSNFKGNEVLGYSTIPNSVSSISIGKKYQANLNTLEKNNFLYCNDLSNTEVWASEPAKYCNYEVKGSVYVNTGNNPLITIKGKVPSKGKNNALKISYALADQKLNESNTNNLREKVEKMMDQKKIASLKNAGKFNHWLYYVFLHPEQVAIWELHGQNGMKAFKNSSDYVSESGILNAGIGDLGDLLAFMLIGTRSTFDGATLTEADYKNRQEIKVDQSVTPNTNYDISNSTIKDKIKNFPAGQNVENYIAVGPYRYVASKGDYIQKIEVKKNGQSTYTNLDKKNTDIIVLAKTKEGNYSPIYTNTNEILYDDEIGKDIETEFYVLVKKASTVVSIEDLRITIGRNDLEATWYYLEGERTNEGKMPQRLLVGEGKYKKTFFPLNYKVNLIPPVQVELDKVDTAGDAVEGAKFSIEYSNGLKGETKTVGKDGKIVFSQVQPTSPDEFTATITETFTPAGYKKLEKPIVLKFTYDQNKAVWKVEKISGPDEKITIGTVTKDSKSGINKIPVTVENKSIIEKLTLLKTSSVGGGKVEGAKFKLTLTNVASIKNHQIPEAGEVTIIETTNADGNLVLEDIEIKDLNEPVVITIEEIEAPVGYKKIEGTITVTLKREGNGYNISETKKDSTVTDDEFKAGKVTLKNHELELNIKDIPIMNLGGIVWTEKIQTDKATAEINNQYDGENQDEALAGIRVTLYKNGKKVAETTSSDENQKATYTDHKGNKVEVNLAKGEYMFTDITAGDDYYVVFEYDGIKYQAMTNSKEQAYTTKARDTKIAEEPNRKDFNDNTKEISGTGEVDKSKTNTGWIIEYDLDNNSTPNKAIYKDVKNKNDELQYVAGKTYTYLSKTEDWMGTWNTDGTINKSHYAFNINCGLSKKSFDLSLGTDVKDATVTINGNQTTYTYDQILDGKLNEALNRPSSEKKIGDNKIEYNLYLAVSDYNYRIADYKVGAIENKYDAEALSKEQIESAKKDSELEVYVTYRIELKNQSTQHDAKVNKVEYHYDDKYAYLPENNKSINLITEETNLNNRVLMIDTSDLQINGGETKSLELTFKVLTGKNGNKCVLGEDYLNQAEIVSYTTGGGLVDEDSAPGNAFLEENKVRYEDDTDEANGIQIKLKTNAERSISGKVFDTENNNNSVNDVIVQLIELVEIENKQQYEYIWQETVAGSNTVKTTDRNGYSGKSYSFTDDNNKNKAGEYKFTQGIIPGNYIVRFIYGDGSTYDITGNTLTYNGEDYKSTYVDYDYNAPWYNNTSLNGENSKAVDNEARRLRVMSYAVDVDGKKGAELAKLDGATNAEGLKDVLANTWMCAETLKIKMPVDADAKENTNADTTVADGSNPNVGNTQFANVNFGLMERPKTKLVLEKHITGLTIKPVASGVNLIANATADINDILKATQGSEIELKGQKDGLFATKSERTNRGLWYLQTDTTELAQGADAYITYTYVIKNEGDEDYLNKDLISYYGAVEAKEYAQRLLNLEREVKKAKKQVAYTNGTYISDFYYTGKKGGNDEKVLASVEQIQEALNPKVKFVNSTTDFTKADRNDGNKYPYYNRDGELQEDNNNIKEIITSKEETSKKLLQTGKTLKEINDKNKKKDFINNTMDTSKKLVVSVGLSASEIENGGVYDSYIAQVTHYTNAAGRRDQSTPDNLSYVHSYDAGKTLEDNNEEDEFWAERFTITKPTGEDKITPVQIAIITISAVAVLGVGIILIKKFVLKK